MDNRLKLVVQAVWLLLNCELGVAQTTKTTAVRWPIQIAYELEARLCFLEMERIVRVPPAEQGKEVAHVYNDLFPPLAAIMYSQEIEVSFPTNRFSLTPEELADFLARRNGGGWPALQAHGLAACRGFLQTHIEMLVPLAKADLTGKDDHRALGGLRTVEAFCLTQLFEEVVLVFQRKNDRLASFAVQALGALNDPRAIPILIRQCPDLPLGCCQALNQLQRGRKAEPSLIQLLDSRYAEIRAKATHALAASGDAALVPVFRKLLKDSDESVRMNACRMPFTLPADGFDQLRPDLEAVLNDPSKWVRFTLAGCFAQRKDMVCAPALLRLLQERWLEESRYYWVNHMIRTLTNTDFGYDTRQGPGSPVNQAAINRFAEWIKEHAK